MLCGLMSSFKIKWVSEEIRKVELGYKVSFLASNILYRKKSINKNVYGSLNFDKTFETKQKAEAFYYLIKKVKNSGKICPIVKFDIFPRPFDSADNNKKSDKIYFNVTKIELPYIESSSNTEVKYENNENDTGLNDDENLPF